ncbi:MAG: carbon-nitrogen hydrolase family protein [Candidatus Latescibacterota bacterium]|nr:MAG: carbon-nitrogen hydrolase family protein [Candidatus Latescibacterota bacterium]
MASAEKACELIARAAKGGAQLAVFPEAFIPGYPDWVWVIPPGSKKPLLDKMNATLLANSVAVPDDVTDTLSQAAKTAGIQVAIGIHERNVEASGSSLYNTLLFIGADGKIMGKHRKLMPTGAERLVWAQGDGSTLDVFDTPIGKISGLLCWENFMPLARNAVYAMGAQIHVAPTWDSSDGWLVTMQHIAKEGGMFVISCCMAVHIDDIPDRYEFKQLYPEGKEWINKGNSCVVGPRGQIIAGPLVERQDILFADIDLGEIATWKWLFDVSGHYARPDVFKFGVNRSTNPMLDEHTDNAAESD